jgi:hypothetical protein
MPRKLRVEYPGAIYHVKKGSAIRALIKRKKRCPSDFLKPAFAATLRDLRCQSDPAFSSFESVSPALVGEAIRSVSHLVLARWGR